MPDLMELDKDGDGKISRQEAPERMQGFFEMLDTNKDGFLDKAEIAAMRAKFQRAKAGFPSGGSGGLGGPPGAPGDPADPPALRGSGPGGPPGTGGRAAGPRPGGPPRPGSP